MSNMPKKWFVIKARDPFRVANTIRQATGFKVYAPLKLSSRKATRFQRARHMRGSVKEMPAIGKYIFVLCPHDNTVLSTLCNVYGVIGILGNGDLPVPISDAEVSRIQKRIPNWNTERPIKPGDIVDYGSFRVPVVSIDNVRAQILVSAFRRDVIETVMVADLEMAA